MSESGQVKLGFVVEVVKGDALTFTADVLAVKYTPRGSGLGTKVSKYLPDDKDLLPGPDEYRIWPGNSGGVKAGYILMVGTPPVFSLRYPQLRALGRRFLEALWESGVGVQHLATTVHGIRTGLGLDEVEAFRSLLLGMSDAYAEGRFPPTLEQITIVEQDEHRALLLQDALQRFLPTPEAPAARDKKRTTMVVMAGPESFDAEFRGPEADETTPHVFVAMPFKTDYDDQFYLAIQPAVTELGFLCERMDLDSFTGDIVDRMLKRIDTARLMVALLDGSNPNVYLEVGYAWGVKRPTILVAREGEPLPFDVRGHRVLVYDKIYRLKDMLAAELKRLLAK